ncbi:bone morphogenetic protein 2 isoform X1 [Diabrotica undecimpunctata]|uniref:bone morphogenetic protein 2 isoform X1 n=2 Tax=Diabrotica undecimpunctata TaxID=50387 RepID=UPI003B63BB48
MGLGCHISAHLAACFWTSFCILALCLLNFSGADPGLFQDLGLKVLPDISKINISINEYTRMMNTYLQMRENSVDDATPVPKLVTFKLDRKVAWRSKVPSVRLRFPVAPNRDAELQSAQLRILTPPQYNDVSSVNVQVNLVLGSRRKRLIEERTFYLSRNSSKWCEADVTSAMQLWLSGEVNLGIELVCLDRKCNLNPLEAGITTLVHTSETRRVRRSIYHKERRTDCQKGRKKRRCCRQNMKVTFSKLEFPEMNFIVEPKVYEAGYCHGLCPPNFNHATNHSRIQSLMHQMEKRNASSRTSRRIIPKACCAPSKLGSLEILLVDKDDPSKLMVEKWDNMKVIECACS